VLIAQDALRARLPGAASLEELALAEDRAQGGPALLQLDRVQSILYTSGTTGRSKAAQLTGAAHLASARSTAQLLDLDERTRWLCCLPLFHVGGLAILHRCALVGGAVLLHERFDAAAAAAALWREGATHASLVATTLQRTLDASADLSAPPSLRAVLVGGGPAPAPLLERARRAGLRVLHTYGLTEASSHVTCEPPGEADGATAGPAVPLTEVRVARGEIEVRGPTLFSGYLGDEPATGAALRDGWLRTGDLGALDERGRLVVHARRSDLILSGGENVYPAEIEAALLAHPAVVEAAVVGRPDAEWGQSVAAAVALRAPCSEAELAHFLRARLAPFKQPRAWLVLQALPRNAAGKVDRAALLSHFTR
jgi:O-succinylbenzoic acid--CoA ligase